MKLTAFRNTPAIIIATGALLLSATGGAVAAGLITGADIKNGTVTTRDIKDETIRLADISSGAESALQGSTGPAGPQGGPGPAGVSGYETLTTSIAVAGNTQANVTLACSAGKKLLGATADFSGSYLGTAIVSTSTNAIAYGKNINPGADTLRLEIHCASAL